MNNNNSNSNHNRLSPFRNCNIQIMTLCFSMQNKVITISDISSCNHQNFTGRKKTMFRIRNHLFFSLFQVEKINKHQPHSQEQEHLATVNGPIHLVYSFTTSYIQPLTFTIKPFGNFQQHVFNYLQITFFLADGFE